MLIGRVLFTNVFFINRSNGFRRIMNAWYHTIPANAVSHNCRLRLKINPQHTVPILNDNGKYIWDSHAVNCYLVKKYGKDDSLYPQDPYKCAIVDQRFHFDTGMLFQYFRSIMVDLIKKRIQSLSNYTIQDVNDAYGILEKFLEGGKWIAGDEITLADFSAFTSITALNIMVPIDTQVFPNIISWVSKCKKLPAFEGDEIYLGYLEQSYKYLLGRVSH